MAPRERLIPPWEHHCGCTPRHNGRSKGYQGSKTERAQAMGIDWMTRVELNEAIPPAYTRYIGEQLMRAVVHSG